MSNAHDRLAAIQRRGATAYPGTALAGSHGRVTRRVRRDRTVRAGVTTLAGAGVLGAGTFGVMQLQGADAVAPMGTPSASVTGEESTSPAPSASLPNDEVLDILPGASTEEAIRRLAVAYDVHPDAVREVVVAALPPEAEGDPEGWLAAGRYGSDSALLGTLEAQAAALVDATELTLETNGVPRDRWQEVLTIASLIEKETTFDDDMPRVATVIANRLDMSMRLELDSSVRFALGNAATDSDFLTGEEREVDSAYNTYANPGLTPGPIAVPSREAIEAANNPADGEWLYFVTVNPDTGEMKFAEDFESHQANVALLQEWVQENS